MPKEPTKEPSSDEPHPIDDPAYWKRRLEVALRMKKQHQAIYMCTEDAWNRIEAKHLQILRRVILPKESILDLGCGWGRLLTLMPEYWKGQYLGVDLSPDFIHMARNTYPAKTFVCATIEQILMGLEAQLQDPTEYKKFDWCIFVSMKDMIILNNGRAAWDKIEATARKVSDRLLILEYNTDSDGVVE